MDGLSKAPNTNARTNTNTNTNTNTQGNIYPGWPSELHLAIRMANWMATYIPTSTDGRPARPWPGVRWMVYVSSLSELSGSLSLSSPLQIRDIAQLAFFLFMRATRASML